MPSRGDAGARPQPVDLAYSQAGALQYLERTYRDLGNLRIEIHNIERRAVAALHAADAQPLALAHGIVDDAVMAAK